MLVHIDVTDMTLAANYTFDDVKTVEIADR